MTTQTETTSKTKRQLKTERRAAFYTGVNFVYGYDRRDGQKRPTVTVSVVPELVEGQLYFGIGIARCSYEDQPNKAVGRARSTARARAVLKMNGKDIKSAPDIAPWIESTEIESQRIILGMRTHWEEAGVYLDDLSLTPTLTDRVFNCCEYLAKKLLPKTTVEA
jgi:hypothetical protein